MVRRRPGSHPHGSLTAASRVRPAGREAGVGHGYLLRASSRPAAPVGKGTQVRMRWSPGRRQACPSSPAVPMTSPSPPSCPQRTRGGRMASCPWGLFLLQTPPAPSVLGLAARFPRGCSRDPHRTPFLSPGEQWAYLCPQTLLPEARRHVPSVSSRCPQRGRQVPSPFFLPPLPDSAPGRAP